MRRTQRSLVLALLAFMSIPASAQPTGLELHGVVASIENGPNNLKFLANVQVTVEFSNSDITNAHGAFRVRLPAGARPGHEVRLQTDLKDYYILLPVWGKARVPARPAEPGQEVEVWVAPKGSKVKFGEKFFEEFIAYTADDSAKQPRDSRAAAPNLSLYLNELARQSGRATGEIVREIGEWAAEAKASDDGRTRGLAEFAQRNFRLAAEHFARAADVEKRRGAEAFRTSAANRTLEGDSYSNALDFEKALQVYQAALDDLKVYRKGRADLGLPAYPEYDIDVADLALKEAIAKSQLGIRVTGPGSRRYLQEAVQGYRDLIARIPRAANPGGWATSQNNLGATLQSLSEQEGGAAGRRYLAEAFEAYRQALTVRTRADLPQQWAETQHNLGNALHSLGQRQGGAEGMRHLADAVEAYRLALTVDTPTAFSEHWAMEQNNLGKALRSLGEREGGAEGMQHLAEAEEAYRLALTIRTRAESPQAWAATQLDLGGALRSLGDRRSGPEGMRHLAESASAFRHALSVFTRADLPREWAATQNDLGNTLWSLGERHGGAVGIRYFAEAAHAYREALEVFNRADLPADWAMTQNNLGNALQRLGDREGGADGLRHLAEAVEACRHALAVRTRVDVPQDWAMTQNNLGNALRSLGERQSGTEGLRHLAGSVEVYRQALAVFTRADLPQSWATNQDNLGTALRSLGKRQGGAEGVRHLTEAVGAYRQALAVRTRADLPQDWTMTQKNLGRALQTLIRLYGFPSAPEQVARLSQTDGLRDDPVASASLKALASFALAASAQDAQARRALAELVAMIERQPDDFQLVWEWSTLRTFLAESADPAIVAHCETLSKLLDALEPGRDRKALLAKLKSLNGSFPTPDTTKAK
jgi:tetratricopeptide (TPR) repeat protein